MHWFDLPGPRALIAELLELCLSGCSVVLASPSTICDRWPYLIRRACPPRERFEELPREVSTAGRVLPALARSILCHDEPYEWRGTVRDLVLSDSLRGRHFVVEVTRENPAAQWTTIVSEWAVASQGIADACDRPTLLLVLPGVPLDRLPRADALLRIVQWTSVADRADLLSYASTCLRQAPLTDLQRRVAISVVASVSGFDHEVVERLSECELEQIMSPAELLRDFARARGWHAGELRRHPAEWRHGMSDEVQGRPFIHSAIHATLDELHVVNKRVWEGQVGVLLPFVEERRLDIVQSMRGTLATRAKGHALPAAGVADAFGLEIGDLFRMRDSLRGLVPAAMLDCIEPLRRIRNDLAHLRPVEITTLRDHRILAAEIGFA